jgi:hypothetical protein
MRTVMFASKDFKRAGYFLVLLFALVFLSPAESMAKARHSSARPSRAASSSKGQKASSSKAKATSRRPAARSVKPKAPSVSRKSAAAVAADPGPAQRKTIPWHDFMKQSGYPNGRPGYVINHILPIECGGADVPSNMQWQSVEESKSRDRTDRNCRR